MVGTAFLAYFLCNWKFYCLAISLFALLFSIIIVSVFNYFLSKFEIFFSNILPVKVFLG